MSSEKVPNPDMEKTKKRVIASYKKGVKPKELSEKYGVSINTVKSWIKRYKEKNPGPKEGASNAPASRGPGAPLGNSNAVGNGGGAPAGNANALKHGGYSSIYWKSLTEEEKELIGTAPDDPEQGLLNQIHLLDLREFRLLQSIKRVSEQKGGLVLDSVYRSEDKRQFASEDEKALYDERIQDKVNAGERLPGHAYRVQTKTESVDNLVLRMEEALSRCQDQKRRAWEALWKLRSERGDDKGDSLADDWVAAVLAAEEADEDAE